TLRPHTSIEGTHRPQRHPLLNPLHQNSQIATSQDFPALLAAVAPPHRRSPQRPVRRLKEHNRQSKSRGRTTVRSPAHRHLHTARTKSPLARFEQAPVPTIE